MTNPGGLPGWNRGEPIEVIVAEAPALQILFDKSGGTTYVGYAEPGLPTSAAVWRILRLIKDTSSLWADGDKNFDNVWDNRAALTYK